MKYYWRGKDPSDIPHGELVEAFNQVCADLSKRIEKERKRNAYTHRPRNI